tara:strand:- start:837 stop:959 length:123 start_codon:yes stop_codon:yes gene_type:complete
MNLAATRVVPNECRVWLVGLGFWNGDGAGEEDEIRRRRRR